MEPSFITLPIELKNKILQNYNSMQTYQLYINTRDEEILELYNDKVKQEIEEIEPYFSLFFFLLEERSYSNQEKIIKELSIIPHNPEFQELYEQFKDNPFPLPSDQLLSEIFHLGKLDDSMFEIVQKTWKKKLSRGTMIMIEQEVMYRSTLAEILWHLWFFRDNYIELFDDIPVALRVRMGDFLHRYPLIASDYYNMMQVIHKQKEERRRY